MLNLNDFLWAVQIAVLAVTVADIISRPKMILEWYGYWLERLEQKHRGLAYALGYCSKCLAGQIAFWSFPFICGCGIGFAIVRWVLFVAVAIFFAALMSLLLSLLTRYR